MCRWRTVCVCAAPPLIPAPSMRWPRWSSFWTPTVIQSDISWRWADSRMECFHSFQAQLILVFSPGSSVQCLWSQHSVHHHLHAVHRHLQYPHILSGSRAPGECWSGTWLAFLFFSPSLGWTVPFITAFPRDLFIFLPVVGATSLPFSQSRVHHSTGCLPDQHHGLWGVCPSYSSTSLLSSRVHLQLWNRRSKVPLCTFTFWAARIIRV